MATRARNFSRSAIAVAATCILGATAALPAMAEEADDEATSNVPGISSTAVAQAVPTASLIMEPSSVPDEPGNVSQDASAGSDGSSAPETQAASSSEADALGSAGDDTSGSAGADESAGADGSGSGAGSDIDAGSDAGATAGSNAGADAAGSESTVGDDDADGDSSGSEPEETTEPTVAPPTDPESELPVEPVEPQPENGGPTVVPEEPGKVENPHSPRNNEKEQSGQPTLNTPVNPERGEKVNATDGSTVKSESDALAETGANELLIVIGIGALLVVGGLILVVLRLRKRGE